MLVWLSVWGVVQYFLWVDFWHMMWFSHLLFNGHWCIEMLNLIPASHGPILPLSSNWLLSRLFGNLLWMKAELKRAPPVDWSETSECKCCFRRPIFLSYTRTQTQPFYGCPSCHPTNNVKALKVTVSGGMQDPNSFYHLSFNCDVTIVTEFTPCNRSLGVGICPLSYQCYDLWRTCDGIVDCVDGYDEIACKFTFCFCFHRYHGE